MNQSNGDPDIATCRRERLGKERYVALLLFTLLLSAPVLDGLSSIPSVGAKEGREMPLLSYEEPNWTDTLDDMSKVYVPETGLVGVELADGEVRLKAGETEGWIASSIITCPPGYRYNLVFIDADVPGNSSVEISILNASRESSVVGFANETIPGFVKVDGADLSVCAIDPRKYPTVRIQANLVANDTDRPKLQSWTMYFCLEDEWRDDFVSRCKMQDWRGLNFTDGRVEIDTTAGTGLTYKPFPPIFIPFTEYGAQPIKAYYRNASNTGYEDVVDVSCQGTRYIAFDDLDGDDNLDMICGNKYSSSQIWWGNGTERWSQTRSTDLSTNRVEGVATGDFNGDGWKDIAFAVMITGPGYPTGDSKVYLNKGNGIFNTDPDIVFKDLPARDVEAGDLNNDGYDDVVFGENNGDRDTHAQCFFGGPNGPDTTVDIKLKALWILMNVEVVDIDLDGYLDVLFGETTGQTPTPVYLGGPHGPDTTPDYNLWGGRVMTKAGDINGDGYMDIVLLNDKGIVMFLG